MSDDETMQWALSVCLKDFQAYMAESCPEINDPGLGVARDLLSKFYSVGFRTAWRMRHEAFGAKREDGEP